MSASTARSSKAAASRACPEENVVELANGCICCTVADDFVPALDLILSRTPKVDHILIETSGLALPKPLVQAFQWPAVKSRVTVDGVIAVVDGAALAEGRVAADPDALAAQRAADPSLDHDDPVEEVFEDQVACADLVILSKSDLIDAAGSARANAHRRRASAARREGRAAQPTARSIRRSCSASALAVEDDIENRKTHHDDELDHEHDDFDSFVVELPAIADPADARRPRPGRRRAGRRPARQRLRRGRRQADAACCSRPSGRASSHHYDRAWAADEPPQAGWW